jgi:hypothetical protein
VTAPQEAGGAAGHEADTWLDMSRYPDTDPDAVLSPGDHDLLSSSLAVDDGALPDAVWEHMLAVVTGEPDPADDVDAEGGDGADATDDVLADGGEHAWSDDLAHAFGPDADAGVHDADPADPASEHGDHGAWDAGWDGGPA